MKNFKLIKFKMAAYRPLFTSTGLILWSIIKTAKRYLHYKMCDFRRGCILKKFDLIKLKMAAYQPLFTFTWPIFGQPC